jgi:tetratricopeptide (TPR) repeat protein
MSIERLVEALEAVGIQADDRGVAEALWLAAHIDPPAGAGPAGERSRPSAAPVARTSPQSDPADSWPAPAAPEAWGVEQSDGRASLYPSGEETDRSSGTGHDAVLARSPAAVALPHTLDLLRALRPLKRRVPSPRELLLDEDATATWIADLATRTHGGSRILPVLRPAADRWLNLALVLDTGPSMAVWQPLVAELRMLFERLGAFRNLRLWHLHSTAQGAVLIHPQADPLTPLRSPRELIDPSGRQAVLLVSDCVDDKWRTRAVDHVLDLWGRRGPLALVQPLPQRLWARAGMSPVPVQIHSTQPALPNHRLMVEPDDRHARAAMSDSLPIPILEIAPDWLAAWVSVLVGTAGAGVDAIVTTARPGQHRPPQPQRLPEPHSPLDRVTRFRASASPQAFKLAGYLAVTSVTLPIMRLVQRVMLPNSRPSHLAELLLSGLLHTVHEGSPAHPDQRQYEFVDGVRDVLLGTLRRSEAALVVDEVSAYVASRLGQALDSAALLTMPRGFGDYSLAPASRPFAHIPIQILYRLGGRYAELADRRSAQGITTGPSEPPPAPATRRSGKGQRRLRPLLAVVSYSQADGRQIAMRLRHELQTLSPPIEPWIDLDLPRGYPFPQEVLNAIGACDVVLFVVTRDSVQSPWCQRELGYARDLGKPILPLQTKVDVDAASSLELEGLSAIDFTDWSTGWDALRQALIRLASPEARLESLRTQRAAFARKASNAKEASRRRRYRRKLEELDARIQEEQRRQADPEASSREVVEGIRLGMAQERADDTAPADRAGIRVINPSPPRLPDQFVDRTLETQRLWGHLQDPSIRLVAIVGRDGIGKTAMISRLLDSLQADPGRVRMGALIYLPTQGSRLISPALLLEDLRKAAPDQDSTSHLAEPGKDSALTVPERLDKVIAQLAGRSVLVVIDNAEDLLDTQGRLRDPDMDEMIRALVIRGHHGVKLLLSTRKAPESLLREFLGSTARLNLDRGIPPADASRLLRRLDSADLLGLGSAPQEYLERAHRLTGGHPRAMELLYGVLQGDPETSLPELLDDMNRMPDDQDTVGYLIVRLFDRLGPDDRRVMQALAIYGRPVRAAAVDHLLQRYLAGYRSEPALRRLLDRRLIRQDDDRFYLPPTPDGEVALSGIPLGVPSDGDREPPPLTRLALLHRAAGYFAAVRRPSVDRLDHLSPQFAEIDLRMRGQDYQAALRLITEIDQEYLRRWGQSDTVAPWRAQLVGKLGNPALELHNLSWLAAARQQWERLTEAIDLLTDALRLARSLGDRVAQIRIQIALGGVYFDNGEVGKAARCYKQALRAAGKRMQPEEARARAGLMLCWGETGQFRGALDQYATALTLISGRHDPDSQILQAELLLNTGWIYAELGQTEDALDQLRRGQMLARRLRDQQLEGLCLDAQAQVLIDIGDLARAIQVATDAVVLGAIIRSPQLSRTANTTLALAHLCAGNLDAASAAADNAGRHRRSRRALDAFAMQGIIAFRKGDLEKASLAFMDALMLAETFREREGRNFQVLDTIGLVLCGLALCGHHEQLHHAVSAYRAARAITIGQGAVRRSLQLLDELGLGGNRELIAAARRAARGP